MNTATANASGGGEQFGQYDTVCTDIVDQIKAREEEVAELTREKVERNDLLVAGSATVSNHPMHRLSSRATAKIVYVDDEMERNEKLPHRSYGEPQRTMGEAIEALEKR